MLLVCVLEVQGSDLSKLLLGFEALLSHLTLWANPRYCITLRLMTRMPALQLR